MNSLLVANVIGWLLVGLGAVQMVPIAAALVFGEPVLPYAASAIAALVVGLSTALGVRPADRRMSTREGFLIVGLGWVLCSLFGSLPYNLTGALSTSDALFEATAGFTTTGSTVLTHIEDRPRALLLWRSMSQWLGGMGIIVFAIALMPLLGVGGMQLFKAEMTGPLYSKLTPRIAETARRLWFLYLGFTAAEWLLLVLAGMSGYEALCHAFTTISTGGFSTRDDSIAGFASPAIEWIIIVFMLCGAINFVLHYRVFTGRIGAVLRDVELRFFLLIVGAATAIVVAALWRATDGGDVPVRVALFQVIAIITSTGYAAADFELWPTVAVLILIFTMVLGGMAGSTTGGVKTLRALIGLRALARVFDRQLHPRAVGRTVRHAGSPVEPDVIAGIWAFFTLYVLMVAVVTVIVAFAGYDLLTAVSAALSAVGNVGPGFGAIGPFDNFAHFPTGVKLSLCVAMIAGRLELVTVLVLFHPDFWRR